MRATMNAQAIQNVNFRQSNARVAGIRTLQASRMRRMHEHLLRSWRWIGECALKRTSCFKAYWHCAVSSVVRDVDTTAGGRLQVVVQRLVWLPVRSVVV